MRLISITGSVKSNPVDILIDLFNQHSRKLTVAVSILLVIWMGVAVSQAVLFMIDEQSESPLPASAGLTPAQRQPTGIRVNLASLDLFGKAEQAAAPRIIEAPETSLNLELKGVFTAAVADQSTAIVAERGKTGELFGIGDRLPGNAVLEAVNIDHILIKRGQRIEKLMFSDAAIRSQYSSDNAGGSAARRAATQTGYQQQASSRLQQIPQRISQRAQEIRRRSQGRSPGDAIRNYIDTNRKQLDENPEEVLTQLGVAAVSEVGEALGYRIGGEVADQDLARAGLMRGDVILSINGSPVGDISNDQALINKALEQKRVRVGVKRDDRQFYLTVPIP
jgi:general secretion pathway protein C